MELQNYQFSCKIILGICRNAIHNQWNNKIFSFPAKKFCRNISKHECFLFQIELQKNKFYCKTNSQNMHECLAFHHKLQISLMAKWIWKYNYSGNLWRLSISSKNDISVHKLRLIATWMMHWNLVSCKNSQAL